jgi:hypothetical protein
MGAKNLYGDNDVKYGMEFHAVLGSVIKLYIFDDIVKLHKKLCPRILTLKLRDVQCILIYLVTTLWQLTEEVCV